MTILCGENFYIHPLHISIKLHEMLKMNLKLSIKCHSCEVIFSNNANKNNNNDDDKKGNSERKIE